MARYNEYVDEVQIKVDCGLFIFLFDNGDRIMLDRGELAKVLMDYKQGSR